MRPMWKAWRELLVIFRYAFRLIVEKVCLKRSHTKLTCAGQSQEAHLETVQTDPYFIKVIIKVGKKGTSKPHCPTQKVVISRAPSHQLPVLLKPNLLRMTLTTLSLFKSFLFLRN